MKEYYIYRWFYKDTNKTFHIGKGKGQRYKEKMQSRNKYFKNIIIKEKNNVTSEILYDNLSEEQAWELEKKLIKKYKAKGECKTNFHEGGCGGNTGNYKNPERSAKISAAAKKRVGKLNPMFGNHHSEETREKIRQANLGKKLSPEHIEKLKIANKGRKKTQAELDFITNLNKGNPMPKEIKEKMMNSLCPYEYQVYLNNELKYTCLGHTELWNYCKKEFDISRTIIDKIITKEWKPTFNKHKWLETLEILKIKRCID